MDRSGAVGGFEIAFMIVLITILSCALVWCIANPRINADNALYYEAFYTCLDTRPEGDAWQMTDNLKYCDGWAQRWRR